MNILIIGGGLIGQERLSALIKISKDYSMEFQITVLDKDEKLLEKIKENFNVNLGQNLAEYSDNMFDNLRNLMFFQKCHRL